MRSARQKDTPVYLQGLEREGYEHGSRSMHRPHGTLQKCNIIADPYAPHHRFVPTYSSLDVFSVMSCLFLWRSTLVFGREQGDNEWKEGHRPMNDLVARLLLSRLWSSSTPGTKFPASQSTLLWLFDMLLDRLRMTWNIAHKSFHNCQIKSFPFSLLLLSSISLSLFQTPSLHPPPSLSVSILHSPSPFLPSSLPPSLLSP
jgi:hypothetical protein